MAIRHELTKESQERFWAKVQKTDYCWLWTAAKNEAGYGVFGVGKATDKAPRLSYRLCVGPIPDGLIVCHKCDNPTCVNPDHLFVGTHKDNQHDAMHKGRHTKPPTMAGWNRLDLPEECITLLGTMADTELGRKFGFNKHVIARNRKTRGIPPFPCQTRFTGKGPHPCWSRKKGGSNAR